jgi:uncharacterized protein (DUF433 family)
MSAIATESTHVESREGICGGEPVVRGTRTTVRAIVEIWRMGVAPEEIPQHLTHLTLGQVFGALSYYADHKPEINGYIEKNQIPEKLLSSGQKP